MISKSQIRTKTKQEMIIIIVLITLLLVLIVVLLTTLLKNKLFNTKESEIGRAVRPGYLDVPMPNLNKIQALIEDPKVKDMEQPPLIFMSPIKIDAKGRPNPFIPPE